jgi:hypothetical protein
VRVFLAYIVAGGVGLNLTAATQVVFNDLDWVPANHWQAEDRAYEWGEVDCPPCARDPRPQLQRSSLGIVILIYILVSATMASLSAMALRALHAGGKNTTG